LKGQIIIPKAVRKALDIQEGDVVTFVIKGDYAVLKPIKKRSLLNFYGVLPAIWPYLGVKAIREEIYHKMV